MSLPSALIKQKSTGTRCCTRIPRGATGPRGPRGRRGATGATGPAGPGPDPMTDLPGHALFYTNTTQPVLAPNVYQDVVFENAFPESPGWTNPTSTTFVPIRTGLYRIQYTVCVTDNVALGSGQEQWDMSFHATVNGVDPGNSQCGVRSTVNPTSDADRVDTRLVVTKAFYALMNGGDTLRIRMAGTQTTNQIQANNIAGDGSASCSASVDMLRVGS